MTPRLAIVPMEATEEMQNALIGEPLPISEWSFQADYTRMLAASPNAGQVSAADLERAAEAAWTRAGEQAVEFGFRHPSWTDLAAAVRFLMIEQQRAALESLGLAIDGDAP